MDESGDTGAEGDWLRGGRRANDWLRSSRGGLSAWAAAAAVAWSGGEVSTTSAPPRGLSSSPSIISDAMDVSDASDTMDVALPPHSCGSTCILPDVKSCG